MAKGKKSFVLYCDLIHTIKKLSNEDAGELLKHLFSYVNDENPKTENPIVDIVFEPIKRQLKRDLDKYEVKKDKKSISGREGNLKRWNEDLYNNYKKGLYTLLEAENIAKGRKRSQPDKVQSQKVANIAVNDNVNVNDNDNVNVNDVVLNNDVFFSLDVLKSQYLQNKKLVKTFIDNPENKIKSEQELKNRIETFIIHLNEVGRHKETFKEFSSYFRHWNKKAPTKASSKEDYHASLKRNIVF